MAQRDYAARSGSKKKKSSGINKSLLFTIAALVVGGFALGLYLLKEKSPEVTEIQVEVAEKAKPKSQLPSRPEETWSYIKELESRTVPTDSSALAKSAQLSEKQKEELKRLEEAEKNAALEKAKKAAQTNDADNTTATSAADNSTSLPTASEEAALAAKAAEEKKLAEQRKKAELAKQEAAKVEAAKSETAKKVEKKPESTKSTGKFGLQCGAFNDRAKAEALQAKLAMTGLNARITESGKWNRVLIGPIGDRPAAANAQKQASSIASCVILGM
ncbi:cell division protein FtsN [Pasteurella langaaensis DSM 22999]|uniref:Cell division protein FtsN n=1 Tax=Alitibacter langaaensis DSM 22999 TaxID=1122935 RepID=A0A2U0SKJ7_9PAST|nr:cell division protein FtsN [Pasteurella langaaensis]PVX31862.1 cell division protein FtsN [Pasteurella langaaensis DSM 22999]